MNNRLLSLCLPKPMNFRSLLNGIGTSLKDKVERLLIESSGNDDGHTEEDTLKQISNTINFLGVDLRNYNYSSQIVRSGRIPTSYEERWDWAKVIELLLKLKRDLMDQRRCDGTSETRNNQWLEDGGPSFGGLWDVKDDLELGKLFGWDELIAWAMTDEA
ncbi:hypothetical protein BCR42DRAFT_444194 [Absidia repens]|uniref:Uncharacterized protein n=1 Tax=Absidia repens TaxID=90262 RepID=A0A1X2HXC7_9FUNG|nr:hypothetical protein BCR42DRAFT_444194 [Absidia repens]